MHFDPSNPQNGQIVDADFLRSQLNGLKDLIDAGAAPQQLRDAENVVSLDVGARTLTAPSVLTATGFGGLVYYDAGNQNYDGTLFNGAYTVTGTHNGQPYWTNPTGLVLYYLAGMWLAGKDFSTFTFRGFGSSPASAAWSYPLGGAGIAGSFAWTDPPAVVATWADGILKDGSGTSFSTGAYSPANPGHWAGSPPATVAEALDRLAAVVSNAGANPIP
ncbi:MAG: hypothetical protein PCFJNLEI_01498 [Verrucomicrobiae bacterium]|nr:hypothetical protein [Verrucomicrobiae bacterium]